MCSNNKFEDIPPFDRIDKKVAYGSKWSIGITEKNFEIFNGVRS